MRVNGEINWKDHCAIEAMKVLMPLYLGSNQQDEQVRKRIALQAYLMAEAMFKERERDEYNPTSAA